MEHLPFAEQQPKDGDLVGCCQHMGSGKSRDPWHWWYFPPHIASGLRLDTRTGELSEHMIQFFTLCNPCFLAREDESSEGMIARIKTHITWKGDEPYVRQARQPKRRRKIGRRRRKTKR